MTVTLITLYSQLDRPLFEQSHHTLILTTYQGLDSLQAVDAASITGVVAMVPHDPHWSGELHWFVVEKPGLDVASLGREEETLA